MPEMNGFELYTEIKKKDKTVKVFFLTALSDMHHYDAFKSNSKHKLNVANSCP
jgi:DNA-binding response OmpR family regulator